MYIGGSYVCMPVIDGYCACAAVSGQAIALT